MNKKLITLAVAGAMVAPLAAAADTTLYGRIDTHLDRVDSDGSVTLDQSGNIVSTTAAGDDFWDVDTNTTRIGVKGSEDLGNGLKAIFQAEWAFSSSEGGSTAGGLRNRLAYAGLTGGFGTVALGRQWTPYYGAVDKTDIFNSNSSNSHYLGTFRTGSALAYVTPNFGGFVGKAAVVIDGGNTASDDVDAYNLSGEYNNGPISVGLAYHNADGGTIDDTSGWGIGGSYNFGMFRIIGQYESWDYGYSATDSFEFEEYSAAAEAYFGKHTIKALVANLDYDADDETNWALGYQYSFSKRTRVFVEYADQTGASRDDATGNVTAGAAKIFTAGFRHDF